MKQPLEVSLADEGPEQPEGKHVWDAVGRVVEGIETGLQLTEVNLELTNYPLEDVQGHLLFALLVLREFRFDDDRHLGLFG
jgi:hypothetical protein